MTSTADILKKVRRIQIQTRHMVNTTFAGQYQSVFKGQGMEFHDVRDYAPGDDIRSIDWNVTARMGMPFVKTFVEEREMTVMLLVDVSASHRFGSGRQLKQDLAAELAAVLAFSAIRNNDRVGLILFTDEVERVVPPGKGTRHVLRIVREVLFYQPRRRGTLVEPALDYLNHIATRRTVTFLIGDLITREEIIRPLAVTARRHDLVAVLVGDKRERFLPSAGLVAWRDAETGRDVLVDTSSRRVRLALEAAQGDRRKNWLEALRQRGIDAIEVYAGEPYEAALIRFFRMRERRLRT